MATSNLDSGPRTVEVVDDITRRRMLRTGLMASAGVALGVLMQSGCGVGSKPGVETTAKPPAKPTGVLRVANNAEPSSLDPTIGTNVYESGIVNHNVYECLTDFKPGTSEPVSALAESFESSPDAREWTFRIKNGVNFHDGESLTSSAVRASFEYYLASPGGWTFLPDKAQFDDSDPLLLRITTPMPYPDMARYVANLQVISPKLLNAGETAVAKTPTGTGPFRFAGYRTAQSVLLEANPDYRGMGPYLERLEFPIIPDPDSRVAALRSGSIDLVLDIPPANAAVLRRGRDVVVTETNVWQSTKLFTFTRTPPMDNLKVRQALAYAIDRQALVDAALGGIGTVDDSWATPGAYGYQPPGRTYRYSPERAKQLLAESGLPTPIKITLAWIPELGSHFEQLAQAISGMAKKADINITVKSVPAAEYGRALASQSAVKPWQGVLGAYAISSGTVAQLFAQDILGYLQFSDPTYIDTGAKILSTPDGPDRLELFARVENRIAELLPLITLFANTQIDAHKANVHGYSTPPTGTHHHYGRVYLAS